jgi:CRP/FNR family transcriptional regulator, anaerobic regulatory protein
MMPDVAITQTVPVTRTARPVGRYPRLVTETRPGITCTSCCLQAVCLPSSLAAPDLERFDNIVSQQRKVARGASLYRNGDAFEALYAVHSGAFKTVGVSRQGDEKITGFYLPGEMLGLDSISPSRHRYDAVALEDSEVCVIPYAQLEQMAASTPGLQRQLFRVLSSDISRDQGLMLLLGSMSAEQRLAAFLLSLSRRYQRLGFSANCFVLRMTREEIGSYLGVTLETVSRLMSRFQRAGLIAVHQRDIELNDVDGLMELVGHW